MHVYGMMCSSCEASLTNGLEMLPGVCKVFASSMLQLVKVSYVSTPTLNNEAIINQIRTMGYEAEMAGDDEPSATTLIIYGYLSSSQQLSSGLVVNVLKKQPGVHQVEERRDTKSFALSFNSGRALSSSKNPLYIYHIIYDLDITGPRTLLRALSLADINAGLPEQMPISDRTRKHQHRRLMLLLLCSFFAIPAIVIELIFPNILQHPMYRALMPRDWLMFVLGTIVQLFVWPFYLATYRSLRYTRQVTMDALLTLSTTVGYGFSLAAIIITAVTLGDVRLAMFFDMNAMLVMFFLLGRYLHNFGKYKAVRALSELKELQANTARLILNKPDVYSFGATQPADFPAIADASNGVKAMEPNPQSTIAVIDEPLQSKIIDIRLVQRHDELLVLPGESIPVDGLVLDGSGEADESLVTGEAVPVEKNPGIRVTGGTILVTGQLRIRCVKAATEGTLAEIGRLIESAQASKISVQKLADRIAMIFCPAAIAFAFLVLFTWLGLTLGNVVTDTENLPPVIFSLNFFIAVLVVACPCAVSLAVPTVLVVATGLASKLGVLVRDGNAFEQGAKVTAVVFDKTGTLTEGTFSVVAASVYCLNNTDNHAGFHEIIGAASTASRHPVSRALTRHFAKYDDPEQNGVVDMVEVPGDGYTCKINGELIAIGKSEWIIANWINSQDCIAIDALRKWAAQHEKRGSTVVVALVVNILHAYALEDKPRDNAEMVVKWLHSLGKQIHLVSGDNVGAVHRLALRVGIDIEHAHGACLPSDKVKAIERLQNMGHVVMFVGDGVNDAPVLAQSHLGVALCSGAEISMQAARAVLMRNNLADVAVLLDLCRAVLWRIVSTLYGHLPTI
ncbi:E1-E2 ATPase-domain-containing protein [Syncephalis fuscata]|nr:E1-E2 ATPase-domain-containing protein [Syncephalis fuscata]